MNRISYFLLTIAAALYLFVNGILGVTNRGGFRGMISEIGMTGDLLNVVAIILSVCGIAAGLFLLLALFRVDVPVTDIILLGFVVLWVIYIVFVDIIGPLGKSNVNFLNFLSQLSQSLMVLGCLMASTRRFGYSR